MNTAMASIRSTIAATGFAAVLLTGCGKKDEQVSSPSGASAAAPAPAQAAAPVQQDSGAFNISPVFDNSGGVNFNSVDSLIQQGQYEQALISVMSAQRSGKATTDDSLKLQRKIQDLQGDVVRRAAAGDQRAIQAMKLLRQTAPSGR